MTKFIEQKHTGSGDNVAGNKYVYTSISTDSFDRHINEILVKIRHKDIKQAQSLLKTLKLTSNLDSDTTKTLELIQITIDIENGEIPKNSASVLNSYVSSDSVAKYKDIGYATLLKLDVKNDNLALALERFASTDNPGENLKEAYYALVADINVISFDYDKTKLYASEGVLCGFVRGALRQKEFKLALSIAMQLCEMYPELNSRILKFACQREVLNQVINGKSYWLINAEVKSNVDDHINELVTLFEEGRGRDRRLNDYVFSLISYQISKPTRLIDVCNRFAAEIEREHPELFRLIELFQGRYTVEKNSIPDKLSKADSDEVFRESETSRILQSSQISTDDAFLLLRQASEESIRNWLQNGGTVTALAAFNAAFAQLELTVFSCSDNPKFLTSASKAVEHLLASYPAEIASVYPSRLLSFCEKLNEIKLPLATVSVLRPLIPTDDIWLSPLVECYIDALLQGEQFKTLSDLLNQVQKKLWTSRLWQIQARLHAQNGKLAEAVLSLEEAIKLDPTYRGYWVWLIHLNREIYKDAFAAQDILNRIPKEIFKHPSDDGYRLLAEFVRNGKQTLVEEKLVSWFINDPSGTAIEITNFYVNVYISSKSAFSEEAQIGASHGGFSYLVDNKSYFKLIVELPFQPHPHILGSDTPLGIHLLQMHKDEEKMFGAQDVKLLEKLPTMVAIFRLASLIREEKNDGTDCFYSFTVPSNEDELLPYLERKLRAFHSDSPEFLKNPTVPVYFKGKILGATNPFAAAVKSFTDTRVVNQSIPNFGLMNFNSVVLDPYSLCYLALANLAFVFTEVFENIMITNDTHSCVSDWIRDINRDDFLSIAPIPSGGLKRTTAEDIRAATADIQRSLLHLLSKSTITVHNLVDYPSELALIDDHIDFITSTSYKLALANDLPWFCLDPMIAHLFEKSGGQIINSHECIIRLSEPVPAELISGIKLFAGESFPFVVTYKKLLELSSSDWELSHYLLSEIIKNKSGSMPSYEAAIEFTALTICHALETVERRLQPNRFNGQLTTTNIAFFVRLLNVCCYEVMQYDRQVEAELKLATFLYYVSLEARVNENGCALFLTSTYEFINGHFLSLSRINEHFTNFLNNGY